MLLSYDYSRVIIREQILGAAQHLVEASGRAYVHDVVSETGFGRRSVASVLRFVAKSQKWRRAVDGNGSYYEPLNSNGYRIGSPTNDALINAGVLDLPGREFGELMDGLRGINRGEETEIEVGYWPKGIRPQELQTPTAGCMLVKAVRHLARAAYDLRRTYGGINMNFSSEHSINTGLRQLEYAEDRWRRKYGDDLIMTDTFHDYAGVGVVGEDYISKMFGITKQEAIGAIRAMKKFPSMKDRVLLTNDPIPWNKLVIIDCRPSLPDTDPLFNFRLRIPLVIQSTTRKLTAELAETA